MPFTRLGERLAGIRGDYRGKVTGWGLYRSLDSLRSGPVLSDYAFG